MDQFSVDGVLVERLVSSTTDRHHVTEYNGMPCPMQRGPCRHGGRCLPRLNDFDCQCTAGFTGALCQTCTYMYSHCTLIVLQDSPADSARHVSFTPTMAAEYILKCAYKQAHMWVCYSVCRAVTTVFTLSSTYLGIVLVLLDIMVLSVSVLGRGNI